MSKFYLNFVKISAGLGLSSIIGFKVIPLIFPTRVLKLTGGELVSEDVSSKHNQLLLEVCKDMNMNAAKISLVYSVYMKTLGTGVSWLPSKSLIALPKTCCFANVSDLKKIPFVFGAQKIDVESDVGKQLLDTCFHTDKQLKFLMARHLYSIKSSHDIASSLHTIFMFYATYKTGMVLPKYYGVNSSRLHRYVFLNAVVWLLGGLVYLHSRNYLSHYIQYSCDKAAAELSEEYCDGGILCLRKEMKMNRIVREMDHTNVELYSPIGNDLSTSYFPKLSHRLKKLKELKLQYCAEKKDVVQSGS